MTEPERLTIIEALQKALCLHPGTDDCIELVRPAFEAIEPLIDKLEALAYAHGRMDEVHRRPALEWMLKRDGGHSQAWARSNSLEQTGTEDTFPGGTLQRRQDVSD